MLSFRAHLSAIAIVVAMFVTGATPLLASHRECLANHHDCRKTAHLKADCCIEQGGRTDEATPASGKTEIAPPLADRMMVATSAPLAMPGLLAHARALTVAPRSSPPDLITLFGTFLV